ncbi:MAG TPA: T9SS type A sorting domain-containing protein [Bacteroidia bacterium]|nr:T9SS type A sorting domain-containing protein [Bacteroidia bacterium]
MIKRIVFYLSLLTFLSNVSAAQILCIKCFNQNDSISNNVSNLLLNGGFEITNCNPWPNYDVLCPSASGSHCFINNWTCTGGGMSTYACILDTSSGTSIIPEGIRAAYFGNGFCNACSNVPDDTSCLNQILCTTSTPPVGYPVNDIMNGGVTGVSLEQTAVGLVAGQVYVLEFWCGGEAILNDGLFAVDIGFGNTFLRNPSTQFITNIGRTYVIQFVANAASHTIKFTNWGHICQYCTELILDNVRLYTLAELDNSVAHCSGTGTNEMVENGSLNIYPNPVTSRLNITYSSNEISEIILYDVSSRIILQQTFTNTGSLNTEQLAKGMYLYEVRNKDGLCRKGKVVKD